MGRSTYKTGRARARNQRDPGLPPPENPVLFPLVCNATTMDAATGLVTVDVVDPTGLAPLPANTLNLTGRYDNITLLVNGGGSEATDSISVTAGNQLQLNFPNGLPLGPAVLLIRAWDESVRGRNGEWLGTLRHDLTVT